MSKINRPTLKTAFSIIAPAVLCVTASVQSHALSNPLTTTANPSQTESLSTQHQLASLEKTASPAPILRKPVETGVKQTQFQVPTVQKLAGYYTYYCTYGYYWNGYYWVWACL